MEYAFQTEKTLSGLFFAQAQRHQDQEFLYGKFEKGVSADKWVAMTWREAAAEVKNAGAGLIDLGIKKGDRIAIFAHNRPRWVIADQAIQAAGGWGVPIYPTSTDDQLTYILKDCGARGIFAGDRKLAEQVLRIKPNVPALEFVFPMSSLEGPHDRSLINFNDLVWRGEKSAAGQAEFDSRRKALGSDDVAAIIYTSGTTGEPKGAVLSQSNFMADVDMMLDAPFIAKMMERNLGLISLCHLPLCHIFGRTSDYHVQIAMGGKIYFAESYEKVPQNLLEVRPQMLITIPRLYEKVFETVQAQAMKLTGRQRQLFDWAFKVGYSVVDHLVEGKKLPFLLSLQFGLANSLVFGTIRKKAGLDRVVFAGSGGGALSKDINRFFRAMNIQVVEGYGLTETTSAVTWNGPNFSAPLPDKWIYKKALDFLVDTMVVMQGQGKMPFSHPIGMIKLAIGAALVLPRLKQKPGTVGRPCKDTIIKIAEDGEILAKGPQIFKKNQAYFNRADLSSESFTEDGFFKTGDIGYFDEDGYLVITDRKKELLVTAGGKNIAPHPIEMALTQDTFIEQVCVLGDARKYIAALLVPQFELLEKWARDKGISFASRGDLVNSPEVKKLFQEKVDQVNQKLARYEQIKRFCLLQAGFSEESGELTPTLKLKRRVIYQKFAKEIESCYRD